MPVGSRPSSPLTLSCHCRPPGLNPGGHLSSLTLGLPSTRPPGHPNPPGTSRISQLNARQDALTSRPFRRPSSLVGLVTSHRLPTPRFGRPRTSPLEDRAPGFLPFTTMTLPRASTRTYQHISSSLRLLRPAPPLLFLPTLTTSLSAKGKSPLYSRSPPTLPPQPQTRFPMMYRSGSTGSAPPSPPPSSLPCYSMVTTPPPGKRRTVLFWTSLARPPLIPRPLSGSWSYLRPSLRY